MTKSYIGFWSLFHASFISFPLLLQQLRPSFLVCALSISLPSISPTTTCMRLILHKSLPVAQLISSLSFSDLQKHLLIQAYFIFAVFCILVPLSLKLSCGLTATLLLLCTLPAPSSTMTWLCCKSVESAALLCRKTLPDLPSSSPLACPCCATQHKLIGKGVSYLILVVCVTLPVYLCYMCCA